MNDSNYIRFCALLDTYTVATDAIAYRSADVARNQSVGNYDRLQAAVDAARVAEEALKAFSLAHLKPSEKCARMLMTEEGPAFIPSK